MKVTVNKKSNNITFSDTKMGDVFIHESQFFMRTQACLDPFEDLKFNAVELKHGFLVLFADDEIVERTYESELTVWQ